MREDTHIMMASVVAAVQQSSIWVLRSAMMIGQQAITITTMPMSRVTRTRFPRLVTTTTQMLARQMQIIQLTMRQTMTTTTVPQKMEPLGTMLPVELPQLGMTAAPQEETVLAVAGAVMTVGAGVAMVAATVAAATEVVAAAVAAVEEAAEVEIDAFL